MFPVTAVLLITAVDDLVDTRSTPVRGPFLKHGIIIFGPQGKKYSLPVVHSTYCKYQNALLVFFRSVRKLHTLKVFIQLFIKIFICIISLYKKSTSKIEFKRLQIKEAFDFYFNLLI